MDEPFPLSFVCCVESGPLEAQTVRMIESLRTWGGALRNAEILAVTPRGGCPLLPSTHAVFRTHGVRHIRERVDPRYAWFGLMNKPKAILVAEREASHDCIVWLDSDTLVLGEPGAVRLEAGEAFAACPNEKNAGTSGPADPYDGYWKAICELVGLSLDDLPWVTTEETGERIRCYFNSGVFAFRKGRGLGRHYFDVIVEILDSDVRHPDAGVFYSEQIGLGLAMLRAGLEWRALPGTHNVTMRPEVPHPDPRILEKARVVHYRGSMWPEKWPAFLAHFEAVRPEVHAWLAAKGPIVNPERPQWRVVNKLLRTVRGRQRSRWEQATGS